MPFFCHIVLNKVIKISPKLHSIVWERKSSPTQLGQWLGSCAGSREQKLQELIRSREGKDKEGIRWVSLATACPVGPRLGPLHHTHTTKAWCISLFCGSKRGGNSTCMEIGGHKPRSPFSLAPQSPSNFCLLEDKFWGLPVGMGQHQPKSRNKQTNKLTQC